MRSHAIRIMAMLPILLVAAGTGAEVPHLINYQGMLTDEVGNPLNGTYDLDFMVYPDENMATPSLWNEEHSDVPVTDGLFNVILGSINPIPFGLFEQNDRWLAVFVDAGDAIEPLMQLTSVPYAMRAAVADSVIGGGGQGSDGDWIISGSDMYSAVSGDVGIGIQNPDGKLQVIAGSTAAAFCDHDGAGMNQSWFGAEGSYGSYAIGSLGRRQDQLGNTNYYGVYGHASGNSRSFGVWGYNDDGNNYGYLGGPSYGTHGLHGATGNYGYLGTADYGVIGVHQISGAGDNPGIYGKNNATGNYGYLGGDFLGAYVRHGGTLNNCQMGAAAYALRAQALNGDAALFYGDVKVFEGRITTPVIEITGGSDLSEQFEIRKASTGLAPEPGLLVSVDPRRPGQLMVSSESYDKKVAGVISGAGGINPGMLMGQVGTAADGGSPVALTGRVYCWADATNGPIEPGDLLTTSDIPGHAMKATDRDRAHGTIIGKAMTSLRSGRGLVLVLVNLQ